MRILLCAEITCGSTRKTVNLHVELVSDVLFYFSPSAKLIRRKCALY
jgi:hypothetical protein